MLAVTDSMPAEDRRSQASEAVPAPDTHAGKGGQETVPDRLIAVLLGGRHEQRVYH